jgi:myo-inositol-1(or 4)-monophosphatase
MDLQHVRATIEDLARRGGEIAMQYWGKAKGEQTKYNIFDIVTEADKKIDEFLVSTLLDLYPDHHFISEEGGGSGAPAEEADYFWHIDPIDGTTNFAHNLPHFSVSIALSDKQMRPLVGVVLNPVYDEMFSAVQGGGATLNGDRLHVALTDDLSQAILATGFSPDQARAAENMRYFEKFTYTVRGTRRIASAALDLGYVAAGRTDGFWEKYVHSWDVMAGLLCVVEAGGQITDFDGGTAQLYSGEAVLASNGLLHDAILNSIKEVDAAR